LQCARLRVSLTRTPRAQELRDELQTRGLDLTGTKQVLLDRLEAALAAAPGVDAAAEPAAEPAAAAPKAAAPTTDAAPAATDAVRAQSRGRPGAALAAVALANP
jgi:hypothetical protein